MTGHAQDRIGIEIILRRELVMPFVDRAELVSKADTVCDLRTELKPPEIQVHAEAHFTEIVHQIEHYRLLAVPADINTCASSGEDVWTVVPLTRSRPLEIQGQIDRHSQHINLAAETG